MIIDKALVELRDKLKEKLDMQRHDISLGMDESAGKGHICVRQNHGNAVPFQNGEDEVVLAIVRRIAEKHKLDARKPKYDYSEVGKTSMIIHLRKV